MKRVPFIAMPSSGDGRSTVVSELLETCARASAADEAVLVYQLINLLSATDGLWDQLIVPAPDIAQMQSWVASGASLAAVAAMLGSGAGYMLSRAPGGAAMATVLVDGEGEEHSCVGETEAIALCGAISAALVARIEVSAAGPGVSFH